jgi:23S rRNA pseudouridine1911/1915/1917 synthase
MHSIGHPLIGDPVYRGKPERKVQDTIRLAAFSRQALHAHRLELTHPRRGTRIAWNAPLPQDMKDLLLMLGESNKNDFAELRHQDE